MKKVVKIDYLPPKTEKQAKSEKSDGQVTHFYNVG